MRSGVGPYPNDRSIHLFCATCGHSEVDHSDHGNPRCVSSWCRLQQLRRRRRSPGVSSRSFSGPYEHRTISSGIGHNLLQEAPAPFVDAIVAVDTH
jgi:hypothetical protein